MKKHLKITLLSISLTVVAGALTSYFVWPDPLEPPKNTDPACERTDEILFCKKDFNDNIKTKDEQGYKTESKAFILSNRVFTYQIETRGSVQTDIESFASRVNETLNGQNGWGQIAQFQRGNSKEFIIVLTQASLVPSFSGACSSQWSCRVGRYVVINEDRWLGASASWNSSGGSLRDYQHMVINHEVGHWLGHGHVGCAANGSKAPVMLQQSIDLQGCKHNPWPLEKELTVLR